MRMRKLCLYFTCQVGIVEGNVSFNFLFLKQCSITKLETLENLFGNSQTVSQIELRDIAEHLSQDQLGLDVSLGEIF